ncbi:MAG: PGPGW domain-containing protein [Planctomyces sp.]
MTMTLAFWLTLVSILTFVVSAAALPWLLARLPEDYLVRAESLKAPRWPRSTALYWIVRVIRNIIGLLLLLAGLVMLVIPGQGILTLLAGLWLLDLPGKTKLERRLAGRPRVLTSINWIRQKAGVSPLIAPEKQTDCF